MNQDRVLYIVGNLIQGTQPHTISEAVIKSAVDVAIKVVKEIEKQCNTPQQT
jgi:hypothetical protein